MTGDETAEKASWPSGIETDNNASQPAVTSSQLAVAAARPAVTVVICTHNRAHSLRTAIESVLAQQAEAVPFELLVVDNRSTDSTAAVCQEYAGQGRLRYLHEPQLGLCFARNTGWRSAQGPIVVYFDDDAVAEAGWLQAVSSAFAEFPNAGVVGGRVLPIWEGERPSWLSDGIALSLTIVDWTSGPKRIPDARVEWLVGANMALRAEVLAEVGGFEPRLDRIGTSMLSGGDVFLQHRVIECGYDCVYYPRMAVRHLVPADRLQQRWFTRRYFWQGISDAVMALITHGPMTRRERIQAARAEALKLLRHPRQLLDCALPTQDPAQFERKCLGLIRLGFIAGLLGRAQA